MEDPCLQFPGFGTSAASTLYSPGIPEKLGIDCLQFLQLELCTLALVTSQSDITCGLRGLKLQSQGKEETLDIYQPSIRWWASHIFSWWRWSLWGKETKSHGGLHFPPSWEQRGSFSCPWPTPLPVALVPFFYLPKDRASPHSFLSLFMYLFYGCAGSSLLLGLSLVVVSRSYSSLQCGGFSYCREQTLGIWASVAVVCGPTSWGSQALEHMGSVVVAHGFSPLQHVACSWIRDQTHVPCPGMWILTTGPPGKSSSLWYCHCLHFSRITYLKKKILPFLGTDCLPSPHPLQLTAQLNAISFLLLPSSEVALSKVTNYFPHDKSSPQPAWPVSQTALLSFLKSSPHVIFIIFLTPSSPPLFPGCFFPALTG